MGMSIFYESAEELYKKWYKSIFELVEFKNYFSDVVKIPVVSADKASFFNRYAPIPLRSVASVNFSTVPKFQILILVLFEI